MLSQETIDIIIKLHDVFVNLSSNARNGASKQSNALQESVYKVNDTFEPLTQQDSHEFLMYVLNCLRDCSSALTNLVKTHPAVFERIDDPASKLCFDYFRKNFMGQRLSTTRCFCCETVLNCGEELIDLFVTLQSGTELDEHFIRNSCVTKERFRDKIKCSVCCRLTEAVRSTTFPHLPRILIVQLGRFENQISKLNTAAPTLYHLDCFCSAFDERSDDTQNAAHRYRLYGVIVHVGRTPTSGHYMAYVRSIEEDVLVEQGCQYENCCKSKSGQTSKWRVDGTDINWYICNDDTITKVVQSDFDSKVKIEAQRKTPYVLFYVRNDLAA